MAADLRREPGMGSSAEDRDFPHNPRLDGARREVPRLRPTARPD
jgi:hypothetical protein